MSDEIEGEVVSDLVVANQMSRDVMLLKMENETIMAAARMQPRNPANIVKQLVELIDAYPAAAEESVYSRPVGTVNECTCSKCKVKYELPSITKDSVCPACGSGTQADRHPSRKITKFAEGLSIRAAESIRSVFGYTRLATTTEILPNGSAKISGTLVDYAAGNLTSDERIVPRQYKDRYGKMQTIPEDRFLGVTVKAEKSKLRRDIILDSTPSIVKALFRDECEKKMKALVAPELIEQKVLPAFAEYGISQQHLEKMIGRPLSMGWKEEDRLQLRKLLTALKNEETTVADILRDVEESPEASKGTVSAKGLDDLADRFDKKSEPAEGPAKDAERPSVAIVKQVNACQTSDDIKAIYNDFCGPESTLAEAERDIIRDACFARQDQLEAAHKPTEGAGNGQLFDSGSPQPQ